MVPHKGKQAAPRYARVRAQGPSNLALLQKASYLSDQITNIFQHKQSWIAFSPSAPFRVSSCLPFSVLRVAMAAPHTLHPPLNYLLTIKLISLSAGLALLGKLLAGAL